MGQIQRTLADGRTVTARHNGGIRKRCGCARAQWPRCSHPWHANFSFDGHEHRVSLHKWAKKPTDYVMLQREAKSLFSKWRAEVEADGKTPAQRRVATITIDTLAKRYLADHVHHPDRRKGAATEMARQVKVLRDAMIDTPTGTTRLGDVEATRVTRPMVEAFRLGRRRAHEAEKVAGKTAAATRTKDGRVATNRLLARLRHLFRWGIAEDLVEASPFRKGDIAVIKLDMEAEHGRSRRLAVDADEEARLLQHAGAHLRACIEATLEAGMRRGEILGLQWQHVHQDLGEIHLPGTLTKTRKPRAVVITPRLAAILEMRRAEQLTARELPADATLPADGHPFGNELGERVKGFRTAWTLTCKRAAIAGLRFHDLRREAASRLLETPGVSLTDARDFLGHDHVMTTNKYLATTTSRIREALKRRDEARTPLAQPPDGANDRPEAAAVTH